MRINIFVSKGVSLPFPCLHCGLYYCTITNCRMQNALLRQTAHPKYRALDLVPVLCTCYMYIHLFSRISVTFCAVLLFMSSSYMNVACLLDLSEQLLQGLLHSCPTHFQLHSTLFVSSLFLNAFDSFMGNRSKVPEKETC